MIWLSARLPGDALALRQALELLQSILPQTEQFKRVSSQNRNAAAAGDDRSTHWAKRDQAVDTLFSALALGEPEDYRRIYLDEGRAIGELLARCQVKQQQSGTYFPSIQYIESLLDFSDRRLAVRVSNWYLPRLSRYQQYRLPKRNTVTPFSSRRVSLRCCP